MTATLLSPRVKVAECAEILQRAGLSATSGYNGHVGHHVRATADADGHYIVSPARAEQFKIRWCPAEGRTEVLGLVDTPARAAGMILDHRKGLLL